MSRIIINIKDDGISQTDALKYVYNVILQGRTSNDGECYCFHTRFTDGVHVIADKKKADIFCVKREKKSKKKGRKKSEQKN